MKVHVERHPTEKYARIIFTAEEEGELHDLDLIHQGLSTREAKESRFEKSNELHYYFNTIEHFPLS